MKRLLSTLLIAAMVLSLFAVMPLSASAAKSGDFEYKVLSNGTAEITGYTGTAANLIIPSKIGKYKVTSIHPEAFVSDSFSTVTIPGSVITIGEAAFMYCTSLKKVVIEESVKRIGMFAFWFCPKLTAITIPKSVTEIGETAIGYTGSGTNNHVWPIDGFTVSGYKGTAAEQYAKENQLKFVALTENLATPKITKFENTASGVLTTWKKVAGAAKYRVFIKQSGKWVKLGDTAGTAWLFKKVRSGAKYTFTVRCLSRDGKSYTSGVYTKGWTTTFIARPALPTLTNTKSGVKVTLKKVAGAVKYRIFRKVGNGKFAKLADTTKLVYLDKTARKGVTYAYTVRCISANGKAYTSAYNAKGRTIKCKR